MSIREEKSWSLWCDWPGCETRFEVGDYSIFGDGWDVVEMVDDSDWWISRTGMFHFCPEHPTIWASDHEDGESFPEPPYLVIHDGDTDNRGDDGRVSFRGVS